MKKLVALFLGISLLFSCASTGSAGSSEELLNDGNPVPYTEEEFSSGLHKLRRAESIFFGSLPVVAVGVNLAMEGYRQTMSGFSAPPLTNDQIFQRVYITLGISAGIALIDFIIGEIRGDKEEQEE